MKKTYMKLFALATMLVMGLTAGAQVTTELEDGMFKAWDSPEPGANEVAAEEASADGDPFGCENLMYQDVGAGATVWGSNKVYYLWYADLTGTQTITIKGTSGLQVRVLMNRPEPVEGGDSHGGAQVERTVTIGDDGTGVVDVSDLSYVHLNAIKLGWSSPSGKIRGIELYGSVTGSGETHTPMELLSVGFQSDVVCVHLSNLTNLRELNASTERVIFPVDCASVKVNGEPTTLVSVEGMEGDKLYIFIDEGFPESEDAEVLVTFKNPADPHLYFTDGRFEGEDVPSFTDMKAEYEDGLGEHYSYLAATPTLVSAVPEDGSFNLPTNTNTFVLEFTANVNCDEVQATLDGASLTISPNTGFSKTLTLTYSGGELEGVKTLEVTNIKPEMDYLEETGTATLTYSFGPVDLSGAESEVLLSADAFNSCDNGKIPEGYIVNFNGEERTSTETYQSGPRMFSFGAGGDFTKALYFREGYCETAEPIELKAGTKYTLTFNSAQWKDNGKWMKFELFDENETAIISQMIENQPNVNGNTNDAVTKSTATSISITVEADGNYRPHWTSTNDRGEQGYSEVLLANVVFKSVPNAMGAEWISLVKEAIENAEKVIEDNSDDRYQGEAITTLQGLIRQYSDFTQFTNPSGCKAAADELNAGAQAVKDHRANCDAYDTIIKKAIDVVRQNGNNKFTSTALFEDIAALVQKYHGSSEWQNVGTEEEPSWNLIYTYDVLMADSELESAVSDLTTIANFAELYFTEGASNPEKAGNPELKGITHFFGLDSNGQQMSQGTGVAVLTNRLLLGAETLMRLGATEEDPAIVAFKSAITDDDQVANQLKNAIVREIAANKDNLFQEITDEATLDTYVETVDMTVYVKNPNIYKQQANMSFTTDNVPGWIVPEGFAAPGLSVGWNHVGETEEIAVDCMASTWGGAYRVEQTINDLPEGVYTLKAGFHERGADNFDESVLEDTYFYAKTTEGDTLKVNASNVGQSFPFAFNGIAIEGVEVKDGKLTIGVNAASGTHTFFNDVRVLMTAFNGEAPAQKPGDVNGDGTVDVADISAIISVMAGTDTAHAATADVNGDTQVDVADISAVITIMAANARRQRIAMGLEK